MARAQRQRGQIIPKGSNKYLLRIFLGRDETGKRKYTGATVTGTIAQAKQAMTKLLREVDTQTFVEPSKRTVKDVCTEWLEGKKQITEKTTADYTSLLDLHVYPQVGHVKLQDLSHVRVQAVYEHAVKVGKLSPRSIQYLDAVLGQAMRYAVQLGYLQKDPTQYVELPRRTDTDEMAILTPDQASLFLEKTSGSPWYALWLLLLTTGMRPQEAQALKWTDYSSSERVLRLQRAMRQVAPGRYEPRDMKTKQSRRQLTIGDHLVTALEAHRITQAKEILASGPTHARQGWVFSNAVGHPWDIGAIRRAWYAALKGAKLPEIRLYDARHTHLSHLLASQVSPKAVAERAGHADATLVMRTYGHTIPQAHREMADLSEGLLFKVAAT